MINGRQAQTSSTDHATTAQLHLKDDTAFPYFLPTYCCLATLNETGSAIFPSRCHGVKDAGSATILFLDTRNGAGPSSTALTMTATVRFGTYCSLCFECWYTIFLFFLSSCVCACLCVCGWGERVNTKFTLNVPLKLSPE